MTTVLLNFVTQAAFLAAMPAGFVLAGETGYPLPDGVGALSVIGALWTADVVPVQVPGFFVIALVPTTDTTNADGSVTSAPVVPASLAAFVASWPLNVTQRVFG